VRGLAGRRTAAAAALVVLLVGLAPGAGAQTTELDDTRAQRDAAEAERVAAEQRLAQVSADVAAGEEELDRLSSLLADVQESIEPTRLNLEAAERRAAAALERASAARVRLDRVRGALDTQRERLAQHAIELYQHGMTGGNAAGVLGSLLSADDTIVEGLPYLQALAENDVVLVEDHEALVTEERAVDDEVRRLAEQAAAQQAAAGRVLAEREDLSRQQADLLAQSTAAQDQRRAQLAELQDDVQARGALVRSLNDRVGLLERSNVGEPPTGPFPDFVGRLPAAGQEWAPEIVAAATQERVDPRLLAALAWTESTFRPNVTSPAGAVGLCQLLPSTAVGLGVDPFVPEQNLIGGARFLRRLLDRYPQRADLALAGYNAGTGAVDRAGPGIPDFPETQLYVTRVLDRFELLAAP
jgi:soluble lytic murein transglycosylase-like protein